MFTLGGMNPIITRNKTCVSSNIINISNKNVATGSNENKGSWVWPKLLKLRPIAYECIRYEVRDGKSFFWFDNWFNMGKLLNITGELGICYLGVSRSATLAEASNNNGWNIRRWGQRRYPQLCDTIAVTCLPEATTGPDRDLWRHGHDDFKPTFSAAKTWDYLRIKKSKLPWHSLVLFPQAILDSHSWFG